MDESSGSQNPPAANLANNIDKDATQRTDLQKGIAVLQQELFDNNERMAEIERSAKDLAVENGILKSNIAAVEKDRTDRIRILHEAEGIRDDLMARKNAAEEKVALLTNRATLFEGQVERLTLEKKYIADELDTTKRALKERLAEKCKLQLEIDQFQQAKQSIEYEKDRWKTEKEILLNSKSWYTKEITERDNTVATLRIQLGSMEARYEAEKALLIDERNDALAREESSQESIESLRKDVSELNDKLKEAYDERSRYLTDFDLEIQAKDRIINSLREQEEEASKENILLREENNKNESLINECKNALMSSQEDMNAQRAEFEKLIEEKEKNIKELQTELEKANELLKVNCQQVSERDIAELSPSAAEAARLIRGKVSLTAIYHEHTKALNKIEQLTEENKRLDNYIKEIVQEFEEKIPKFMEERESYKRLEETCSDLDHHLAAVRDERDLIEHQKTEIQRELNFTKGRLESVQIAHEEHKKRVKFLTYLIEKGQNPEATDNENDNDMQDDLLFRNIEELHEMNVSLRERLRVTDKKLEDAIENARNDEAQKNLEVTKRYEAKIRENEEQMRLMGLNIQQLQEQVISYKTLAEQAAIGHAHATSPLNSIEMQELRAEKEKLSAAYESLRERFEIYRQERTKADEVYEQRIEQQIQLIGELRAVKAKLDSDVASIQCNAQAASKQILQVDKDMLMMRQRLEKANTDKKLADQRVEQVTKSLMIAHEEIARHKTSVQILQTEVEKERRALQRVETELQVLRHSQSMSENIARTLSQLDNRLKFVDDERTLRVGTQMDALTVERDNLKTLLSQMNDDVKRSMNDRELERQKYAQEVELLKLAKKKAEQEMSLLQNENDAFKAKVSTLEKQFIGFDKESGDKKANQQVINRNDYLETQVRELEEKLDDANMKLEAKDRELATFKTLTAKIEDSLKDKDQFSLLERNQLQSQVEGAHAALSESRDIITRLREQIATMESEATAQSTAFEQRKYQYELEVQEFERRLNDMERLRNEFADQVDSLAVKVVEQEGELATFAASEQSLKAQIEVFQQEMGALRTELEENQKENANYKSKLSVSQYEAERLLSIERDEVQKLRDVVAANDARDKEHGEKVELLYNKIEELVKRLAVAETVSSSMFNASSSSIDSAYDPSNSMESMSLLIEYMRKEKAAAIERSSTAELKLKTAVAQATIDHEKIHALEGNIKELQTQIQVHLSELKDKNELVSRLNLLQSVQSDKKRLEDNVAQLTQALNNTNKMIEELNQKVKTAETEKQIEAAKAIDALSDLANERRDKEAWRQRYQQSEETSARNSIANIKDLQAKVASLEGDNKKYIDSLAKTRTEKEQLQQSYQKAVTTVNSLRTLAKKYKDQAEARESTSASVSQAQYEQIQKEKDELAEAVQKLKKQVEEVEMERDEAQLRLSALSSTRDLKRGNSEENKEEQPVEVQQRAADASPTPGTSQQAAQSSDACEAGSFVVSTQPSAVDSSTGHSVAVTSAQALPSSSGVSFSFSLPKTDSKDSSGTPSVEPAEARGLDSDVPQSSTQAFRSDGSDSHLISSSSTGRGFPAKRRHPDVEDLFSQDDSFGDTGAMNILAEAAAMRKRFRSSPTEVSTSSEVGIPNAVPESGEVEEDVDVGVGDVDVDVGGEDDIPDAGEDSRDSNVSGEYHGDDVEDAGNEELPQPLNQEPDVIDVDDEEHDEDEVVVLEPRADANLPDDELDEEYDENRNDDALDLDEIEDEDEGDDLGEIDVHYEPNMYDDEVSGSASGSGLQNMRSIPAEPVVYDVLDSSDDEDFARGMGDVAYEPADSGTQSNQGPLEDDDNPEDPTSSPSRRQ
ncbi:hypothetical protein QR680_001032 [Steinernema hermaphroditum]|uniref:Nucleoprotein TPR n=1 Tax=Steinernema hermaphroditum TaxID=289476 RepID=A0AA39GYC1_9BILA|nr:hypothetical protein QR680_001032 [Steinernema hermaphroditum]